MADTLTITLTGRPPLKIVKDDWPFLASSKWHDGQVECQANRTKKLIVRQHKGDRRTIVYGIYDSNLQSESNRRAGVFLDDKETTPDMIVAAIRKVGGYLGFDRDLVDDCIADLPAEEVI